jgi:uracil-DNA glycosylase
MDDRDRLVRQCAGALAEVLARQVSLGRARWTDRDVQATLARIDELEAILAGKKPSRGADAPEHAAQGVASSSKDVRHNDERMYVGASPGAAAVQETGELRRATDAGSGESGPIVQRPEKPGVVRDAAPPTLDAVPWAAPVSSLLQETNPDVAALARISPGDGALAQVAEILGDCQRCGLCRSRKNIVFGVGNPTPRLMFIGEGPGADEDTQGIPFVGKAGQLLTKMIGAMGLTRDDVYIANVVKCRPPDNREPAPDEVAACLPFLQAQVRVAQPEVIVTLGRTALQGLTGKRGGIMSLRGNWLKYNEMDVMPTFHPSYLLREESAKAAAWADLQLVMKRLGLQRPR